MIQANPNQTTITQGESVTEIEAFVRALHGEGNVFEIRIPNARIDHDRERFGTVVGVFNDCRAAAEQITRFDQENQPPAIYVTLQKLSPSIFCRCTNQLGLDRGNAVKDSDVEAYRWILIDLDPKRPKGVSSTQEELQAAAEKADEVAAWLESQGFPKPLRMLSGNGYHFYLRVNLPASEKDLVKRFLQALSLKFSDDQVELDRTVHNPSRITKVAGTWARKGEATEERPHRMAKRFNSELESEVVMRELLEAVIQELKPPAPSAHSSPEHRLVRERGRGGDLPLPQLEPIRNGCEYVEHCFGNADSLPEPEWLAALGIVARCENGIELAHEMSRPYPGYSFEETEKKIQHAMEAGPRLCSTIEEDGFEGCRSCPHRDKISTPLHLGRKANATTERINLDAGDPTTIADAFLEHHYTHEDTPTLVCVAKDFYAWNGACYREISDSALRSKLHGWLRKVRVPSWTKDTGRVWRKTLVTKSSMDNLVDALRCITHRDIDPTKRQWLTERGNRPEADRILTCSNWLLDLLNRKLHAHTPDYFTTIALDIAYDPDAPPPKNYLRMLESQWGDDPQSMALHWEWTGYLVSGDTHLDKIMLIVGSPRSGKGAYGRLLPKLLGVQNVVGAKLSTFGGRFDLAGWLGKSLVIFSDARKGAGNVVAIETLLSVVGRDLSPVERKYLETLYVELSTRVMILSNEMPKFYDSSGALASRFLLLRTKNSFLGKEDHGLEASFDSELPGILNMALDAYDRLRENSWKFTEPESLKKDRAEMEEYFSRPKRFMADTGLVADPELRIDVRILGSIWKEWCAAEEMPKAPAMRVLLEDLKALIPHLDTPQRRGADGKKTRWVEGIGFLVEKKKGEGESERPHKEQLELEPGTSGTCSGPFSSLPESHSHRNSERNSVPLVPPAAPPHAEEGATKLDQDKQEPADRMKDIRAQLAQQN